MQLAISMTLIRFLYLVLRLQQTHPAEVITLLLIVNRLQAHQTKAMHAIGKEQSQHEITQLCDLMYCVAYMKANC